MASRAAVKTGLYWQSASLGLQVIVQLLVLALLARLVQPQAFGLVAASYVAIDLCQLLSEAGASAAVIHRQKLDADFVGTAWSTSIAIGIFFFICLALLSGVVTSFLAIANLRPVLIALGGVFVLMGVARVPEALLQRDLKFATVMKVNAASQVFGYALPAIVLALLDFGVWALVAATLLQWAIKAVLLCLIRRGGYGLRFSRTSLNEMLSYGLGVTKEKLWIYVMAQGDRFMIGRRLGPDALGQYHVMAVSLLPSRYFGDVIDSVFFPVMARMRNDRGRLIAVWLQLMANGFVFMSGVGVFLAANGESIVRLTFGGRWIRVTAVFQWLCIGAGIRIVGRISDSLNRAIGQVHETASRKMFVAILFVPAVWYASSDGLVAVCVVLVLIQLIDAVLQVHLAWRGLGFTWGDARSSVRQALTGTVTVLGMNGLFLWIVAHLQAAWWLTLSASLLGNAVVALLIFWPLIRLWRDGGGIGVSGVAR